MKRSHIAVIAVASLPLIAAVALYISAKWQPPLETMVRNDDPVAALIIQKAHACGQSRDWEIPATLHRAEEILADANDLHIWRRLDRRSTTQELVDQCRRRGFKQLHGDCKATAVLVAEIAEHYGIAWRMRSRPGRSLGKSGHAWTEVLIGKWFSIGAKTNDETEFPPEAAPDLPVAGGSLAPGHIEALFEWAKFTKIPL